METAALVLGIISLAVSVFSVGAEWIGSVCGILAIIFGAMGMKKNTPDRGKAKAGLIMGIISLFLGVILTIACVVCVGTGVGVGAAISSGM